MLGSCNHVTLALLSHLMFAAHIFMASIISSGKWNMADFLGNLNLMTPRLC